MVIGLRVDAVANIRRRVPRATLAAERGVLRALDTQIRNSLCELPAGASASDHSTHRELDSMV